MSGLRQWAASLSAVLLLAAPAHADRATDLAVVEKI